MGVSIKGVGTQNLIVKGRNYLSKQTLEYNVIHFKIRFLSNKICFVNYIL